MNHRNSSKKITRREFLIGQGVTLAWLATGCGQRSHTPTPSPPTPVSPSPTPTSPAVPLTTQPPTTPVAPAGFADLILRNGKVITVDRGDTIAQAVAVKDDRILAVGSNEKVATLAGGTTQVVDLKGKTVTPGLIDPHNHLQVMGLMQGFYSAE